MRQSVTILAGVIFLGALLGVILAGGVLGAQGNQSDAWRAPQSPAQNDEVGSFFTALMETGHLGEPVEKAPDVSSASETEETPPPPTVIAASIIDNVIRVSFEGADGAVLSATVDEEVGQWRITAATLETVTLTWKDQVITQRVYPQENPEG